ncbi:MAG: hypothetical protein KGI19_10800 [Thaumarchaeota archaeon]|nr:hypothetical protein [Nitrososphaerota archaeon]
MTIIGFLDENLANITFILFDMLGGSMILTIIFNVDSEDNIHTRFSDGEYKKTWIYISIIVLISIGLAYFSQYTHDQAITFFQSIKLQLVPLFGFALSSVFFWNSKILLGRRWLFPVSLISLIGMSGCVSVLIYLVYYHLQ